MADSSPPFSSDSDISSVSSPECQSGARATVRRTHRGNHGAARRNASEKEKLRMRDLTKALQNLRRFLPPSAAPSGQTLTKIETLRLAARYISHLSAQLHLQVAHCQEPELRGTPGNLGNGTEKPHGGGHMTVQSESGFLRGGTKAEIHDCYEIFGFHTLTNPPTSPIHQDAGEDERRGRAAHDVWT